jgi:DNA-binding cell septation regulator SpoVG
MANENINGTNTDAGLEVSEQAEYNHYLTEAPITEFAEYAGIDLDEAVNRRIAAAVEASPMTVDATVRLIDPKDNLFGFANVTLNGGAVTVTDVKVLKDKEGNLFAGMPSKKDPSSRTGYSSIVRFSGDELKEKINVAVVDAYYVAGEKLQARAAAIAANKPAPIKEQYDKAAKEAAKHNAERTAPAKSKDKNAEH